MGEAIPVGLQHQVSNPGRTTWMFLRYVEPALVARHLRDVGEAAGGGETPGWLAEGLPPARALLELVRAGVVAPPPGWPACPQPPLRGAPPGASVGWLLLDEEALPAGTPTPEEAAPPEGAGAAVAAAAELLDATGLLFYPQLATGAVVLAPAGEAEPCETAGADVVRVRVDGDAAASAARLLTAAAAAWFRHGARAEASRGGRPPGGSRAEAPARAAEVFVTSVRFHFLERLRRQGELPDALHARLRADRRDLDTAAPTAARLVNDLGGHPLLKDFLACAFPLWDIGELAWRNAAKDADITVDAAFGAPVVHMEGA